MVPPLPSYLLPCPWGCPTALQADSDAETLYCPLCQGEPESLPVTKLSHPLQVYCAECESPPFVRCYSLPKGNVRETVHAARYRWYREMSRTGGVEA